MSTIDQAKTWLQNKLGDNILGIHGEELTSSGEVQQFDINCLVTTKNGTNIVTQPVNFFNGEFSLGGNRTVANYIEPPVVKSEQQESAETFIQLEQEAGGEIKVDPTYLANLGIKFFAFQSPDGKNKVTTKLNGQRITRETI